MGHWRVMALGLGLGMSMTLGASVSTGCAVDTEFPEQADTFTCQTDEDCLGPQFICSPATNLCIRFVDIPDPECIDMDGDGYGANPDGERIKCRFPEKDTNDNDADIYPNAPELCDGKDNDSNSETDEPRPCESLSECNAQESPPNGTRFECIDSVCKLKSNKQSTDMCKMLVIQCTDGKYEDIPEDCQL